MKKFLSGCLCVLIMMSFTIGSNAFPDATNKAKVEVSIVPSILADVPQPLVADLNYSLPVPDENAVKPLIVVNLLSYDSLAANAPISPQLLSPVKYNIAAKNVTSPHICYGNSSLVKYGGWCSPNLYPINI